MSAARSWRLYGPDSYEYTIRFPDQVWTSRTTACATIGGNPTRYSAAGTGTITRPGGTLIGQYATSNLLPVPRDHVGTMHITGGTGLYEGASGTCVHTNWTADGSTFTGTVTCDISPK